MKDVGNTFFNVMKHGMMNSESGAFKSDPFHKIAISTDLEIKCTPEISEGTVFLQDWLINGTMIQGGRIYTVVVEAYPSRSFPLPLQRNILGY